MKLDRYLKRIGLEAPLLRPDMETLGALQRAHILAVPFENLDVQLQSPLSTSIEAAYDKIVERGRGGWCYEMNGVFGWALSEIGFDVKRASGGVRRDLAGDDALGNHLCLIVQCEGVKLVDVGFGGSLTRPLELKDSSIADEPFQIDLKRVDGAFWRFSEDSGSGPFTFDFSPFRATDERVLSAKCAFLQSDASSPFVQNLVVQRRRLREHVSLRGRLLTRIGQVGVGKTLLQDADELTACLNDEFDLKVPAAAALWPQICARHEALFGAATRR